jgi:hypothetical protein
MLITVFDLHIYDPQIFHQSADFSHESWLKITPLLTTKCLIAAALAQPFIAPKVLNPATDNRTEELPFKTKS